MIYGSRETSDNYSCIQSTPRGTLADMGLGKPLIIIFLYSVADDMGLTTCDNYYFIQSTPR